MTSTPSSGYSPDVFRVIVRGQLFELSRAQITYDAPNLFTSAFLGDFSEAASHTLRLDRDPDLFAIIVDHLSGYEVLPLEQSAVPRTMGVEKAMRNLRLDAEYLGLEGLISRITTPRLPPHFTITAGLSAHTVEFSDILGPKLPDGLVWSSTGALQDICNASVLVHAKNVGITFLRAHQSAFLRGEYAPKPVGSSAAWVMTDPNPGAAGACDWYGALLPDALIRLDGLEPVARYEIFGDYDRSSDVGRRARERAFQQPIWGDEVWFTIAGQEKMVWRNGGERTRMDVRLLAIRARTRGAVVEDSWPVGI
jgi:hypothetical protein